MQESLSVSVRQVDAAIGQADVVELAGSLNASSTIKLEEAVVNEMGEGARCFVLDFAQVDYISSAGLRLLLKLRKAALDAGGRVVIASLHRDIRENVFDALGFSRLLDVYPTVNEAIASLGQEENEAR